MLTYCDEFNANNPDYLDNMSEDAFKELVRKHKLCGHKDPACCLECFFYNYFLGENTCALMHIKRGVSNDNRRLQPKGNTVPH